MENLKILFASPEVVPFSKTGGLADVSGILPRTLSLMGYDVKVITPKYSTVPQECLYGADMQTAFDVKMREEKVPAQLFRLKDKSLSLEYLLIGNSYYFDRPELYRDRNTGKDYTDNDDRFIFFCRAVLESLKKINWVPDIIHANDWQTALLPVFLATGYKADPFFADTGTIFTIHNMAYQGAFPATTFAKLGLPADLFYATGPLEFWGMVNFMKSAIVYADVISTVSPHYAVEIQSSEDFGCGLEGVLRTRHNDIYGVLNGADYSEWSPTRDKYIPHKYHIANLTGKNENKIDLLNRLKLPYRETAPLIGMITRLADQKGLDLIAAAANELFSLNLQMVILGTGEKKYHDLLAQLEKKYPDKLRVVLAYDNELAHWIEAGADIYLMPSRYEPCGLNQIYSLKYGTVPIVRATGGLIDTISNVDATLKTGTGFVFEEYHPVRLVEAVRRAVDLFPRKRIWRRIVKDGMKQDFSWISSAKEYVALYQKVAGKMN